jgi:hypothetical protein
MCKVNKGSFGEKSCFGDLRRAEWRKEEKTEEQTTAEKSRKEQGSVE